MPSTLFNSQPRSSVLYRIRPVGTPRYGSLQVRQRHPARSTNRSLQPWPNAKRLSFVDDIVEGMLASWIPSLLPIPRGMLTIPILQPVVPPIASTTLAITNRGGCNSSMSSKRRSEESDHESASHAAGRCAGNLCRCQRSRVEYRLRSIHHDRRRNKAFCRLVPSLSTIQPGPSPLSFLDPDLPPIYSEQTGTSLRRRRG